MAFNMFMYFFLQSKINYVFRLKHSTNYRYILNFNGFQTVEGQNYSFSAASKGYKRHQTTNKGLI